MFGRLFLLFTLIPVIELYTLVQVGSVIGAFSTIMVVIITGAVGAWLARMEGLSTMMKVRESLNRGAMPADEMVEGLLILVAGIVLLTPGFITDLMGLVLLFPPTRKAIARTVRKQFRESARMHASSGFSGDFGQGTAGASGFGQQGQAGGFTYYTWSSGDFDADSVQRVERRYASSEVEQQAPRKAVVIDCEPADDAAGDTHGK